MSKLLILVIAEFDFSYGLIILAIAEFDFIKLFYWPILINLNYFSDLLGLNLVIA